MPLVKMEFWFLLVKAKTGNRFGNLVFGSCYKISTRSDASENFFTVELCVVF